MIDVWFDCRQDANGKDPDQHSPTLKRYHAELWTKPLPDGRQTVANKTFPLRFAPPRLSDSMSGCSTATAFFMVLAVLTT